MDKDNSKDFTFVKLSDLKANLTFRMYVSEFYMLSSIFTVGFSSELEGTRDKNLFSDLLENPELRFHGAQLP